jgi:peroxiredoxin
MTDMIERPGTGRAAPAVDLLDSSGASWHLDDHRGHPVVLIFHRHIH